eukprot:TRINITY_DN13679_c0_g1_i1.p1 TRINITY_DN13679_c0_g1~~TRINITY_DN13679_c0_g1_i1.p1  ORF type:complete len:408 (+),score=90.77 TRINITY_DN13679_c0_g1_i1:110-1333(+)
MEANLMAGSKLRLPEFRGVGSPGVKGRTSTSGFGMQPGVRESVNAPIVDKSPLNHLDLGKALPAASSVSGGSTAPTSPLQSPPPPGRPAAGGGQIRVAVRVRPLPAGDEGIIEVVPGMGQIAIRKDAATGGNEFLSSQQGRIEARSFDQVFGPEATQAEVFEWSCEPLLSEAIQSGRSATVFVYGATGAGKTHTMFGGSASVDRGLILRAIPEVFRCVDEVSAEAADGSYEVTVSFLELYNEVVRDLLQPQEATCGTGGASRDAVGSFSGCRVLEDASKGVVKVANLLEVAVRTPDEALWYLQAGMQARTIENTAANSQSSRAHAVFSMNIEYVRREPARPMSLFANKKHGQVRSLHSKISLIDLAGSERACLTQNSSQTLKDGARINQSLLALANCIDALTQHRAR